MSAILWPLLIYWLVLFVSCYTVVEVAQDQFYDAVTPRSGLKVAVGALIFAALATWLRPSLATMFTEDLAWTVLQAIVWFVVFIFVFEFHPPHALALSTVTMVLVTGLASLGVDNLTQPARVLRPVSRTNGEPTRRPTGPGALIAPKPAATPAK